MQTPLDIASFYVSLMRTSLNMTSLSIAIIGFASLFSDNNMKMFEYIVKILGGLLFIISSIYGFHSTANFNKHLENQTTNNNLSNLEKKQINSMKVYSSYHYIFLIISFAVAAMFSYMKIPVLNKINNIYSNYK